MNSCVPSVVSVSLLLEGCKKSHGSLMAIRVKELKDKTKEQSPCLELS